jgi:hypothetical protein
MARRLRLAQHTRAKGTPRGLTHGLFRFPAKMHPPLVRVLLARYTRRGDRLYDPFVGSGTLLVEAAFLGRDSIGTDVDPLALLVAEAKTSKYDTDSLVKTSYRLQRRLKKHKRSVVQLAQLARSDLSDTYSKRVLRVLRFPAVPNRDHWFKRYVAVDLARLLAEIRSTPMSRAERTFFKVCALAIVRTVSRADPIPSSGLEVTQRMLDLEREGRVVDVFSQFDRHVRRQLEGVRELAQLDGSRGVARVKLSDARTLRSASGRRRIGNRVDGIVTSPPYVGAIEYLRRHRLERSLMGSAPAETALRSYYIGRKTMNEVAPASTLLATAWYKRLAVRSTGGARRVATYFRELTATLSGAAELLPKGAPLIVLIGDARVAGVRVPTAATLVGALSSAYRLVGSYEYELKNRYMSYYRRNGPGISRETVLLLRKRAVPVTTRHRSDRRGDRRGTGLSAVRAPRRT